MGKRKTQEIDETAMQALAKAAGLTFDGGQDNRLFAEYMLITESKGYTKKEYTAMEKHIRKFSIKGPGFEVYAWNDISGYDYWTLEQEEDNYIQITALILDLKKVNKEKLKSAIEDAEIEFTKYARQY